MKSMNIGDIAKLSGVLKATVSRVLNHSTLVSQKTKEKVLKIIEENILFQNMRLDL